MFPEPFLKIGLDLAEVLFIKKIVYLFVCLFVFCLNHLMIPTVRFPESFIKIGDIVHL